MKVSAKGEYAIRAVLDLALHEAAGLRPIQDVAAQQHIPQRYLEQVLLQLKRAGLLASKRGSAGGYRLSRRPREITVGEVLRAVEGGAAGLEGAGRSRGRTAADADGLAGFWGEIDEALSAVVDRTTFEDLRQRAEERRRAAQPMYHI
ncbi:MAG: Rrf2 family transcriptional regulator [Candidatus Rokubacteria bacterium]|nr:Rrf2 family transcriptional regulator [Candidatus Rokubacteria bacterium]